MKKLPQKQLLKVKSIFFNKNLIKKNKNLLRILFSWSLLIGLVGSFFVTTAVSSLSKPKKIPSLSAYGFGYSFSENALVLNSTFRQENFSASKNSCQGKYEKALSSTDKKISYQEKFPATKINFQKELSLCLLPQEVIRQPSEKENLIRKILAGTPMEKMAPFIALKNQKTAAFLIGIALKESGFGRNAPHKNGQDCYNYWGYKGNINPTSGGYSCFNSPQEAVEVVGKRIEQLINQGLDTPAKMIVWKCGSACQTHSSKSKSSWIKDVSINYQKIISLKN